MSKKLNVITAQAQFQRATPFQEQIENVYGSKSVDYSKLALNKF